MAFKMKNPGLGQKAKAAGSPHKFGIAGEFKGQDSVSRGTSAMKKKSKFRVDTRGEDYTGKVDLTPGKPEKTLIKDESHEAAVENVRKFVGSDDKPVVQMAGVDDTKMITETESENKARMDKLKSDDSTTSTTGGKTLKVRPGKINVKVKGRKDKSGLIADPQDKAGGIKDIKKVKMSAGKGKSKKTVKVKYDKEGNVKKETTRYGALGLRKKRPKGGSASVGVATKEGKDVKGAAAAERIIKKSTSSNIRSKKRKEGKAKDESALKNYKKGYYGVK